MHAAREENITFLPYSAPSACNSRVAAHMCACRRSLIGDGLDVLLHIDSWDLGDIHDSRAGQLLLLHLCNPAQYGVDLAATACAALVTLLTGASSNHAHSSEEMQLILTMFAGQHSDVLIAAMQHDGFAAALAEQRHDAIAVLAAAIYHDPTDAAGEQQADIIRANQQMSAVFAASAVQVCGLLSLPLRH
jgi:hypothetical protein